MRKSNFFYALSLVCLIGALVYWNNHLNPPEFQRNRVIPQVLSKEPDKKEKAVSQFPPSSEDSISDFNDWSKSFCQLAEEEKKKQLELGMNLAKQRRPAFKALIEQDPRRAMELAVPMVVRQKLPQEILNLLEDRVRVRADFELYGKVPEEGAETRIEPYSRNVASSDGRRWNAFVYGRRAWQRTTTAAAIHGVAIDDSLAVSDSSVRILELGEKPELEGRETVQVCPISGENTELNIEPDASLPIISSDTPAVETPEKIIYVCQGGHISQVAEDFLNEEEKAHWDRLNAGAGSGTAHGPISTSIPSSWTTGNRTFLYIRACFPDNPIDPQNEQECHTMLKQANDYIMNTSYGRCYLTYTVAPLVVLPYPQAWYDKYEVDRRGGGDILLGNHAIQIAKSMGYDASSYHLRAVRWSGGPGTYGGSARLGDAGMWMKSSQTGVFLHELGHNLGLLHANYWRTSPPSVTGPGNNLEYGNSFDVLGDSSSMGQYTSSFKKEINWLASDQFWNVTSSGRYRISQTDSSQAHPNQRYALRIRADAERDYWAEFRLSHTSNTGFTNGLFVTFDQWGLGGISGSGGSPYNGSNNGAQLLDMTPGSFGNGIIDTRNDSALWVGRTYSDNDFKVHMTPVAKNTTTVPPSMDVEIQLGDTPGNLAPTLVLQASATSVSTGIALTLSADASDPNGDSLAYAWTFDDGTYSTNNSSQQFKSWSTAGHYQVLCTASDMKGKRTTKAVLITVGSPTTFTVSGKVTGPDLQALEGVYVANYTPSNTKNHSNSGTFRGTWTDSEGNYTLTRITSGSYTFSSNLYPYVFSPSGFSLPLSVSGHTTGRNFTSASLPKISISYPDGDLLNEKVSPTPGRIRLTREASNAASLTVQIYNTNTGSASRTEDYSLSPAPKASTSSEGGAGTSEYVIPAGANYLDITMTPINDSKTEGLEIASLDFVNTAQGYVMAGNPKAQLSIIDDESALPVVKISPLDDVGGELNSDAITLKIQRSGATNLPLSVSFVYSGSASRNSDFTAPLDLVIPVGESSAQFVILPIDDADIESTEDLTISLSTSASYLLDAVLSNSSITCHINDNDLPEISALAIDANASETAADKGLVTITRTGSTLNSLTVDYSVGGRAVMGSDYRRLEGRATIPAGLTSTSIEIIPFDDLLDEGTQDVILKLRSTQSYSISSSQPQAEVTIQDNDDSQFYVEMNTGSGVEPATGSANGAVFQIHRPSTGTALTVNYMVSGTATSGVDFTSLSGTLSFTSVETNKTITVSMLADAEFENAESIVLTLLPGAGYSLLAGQNHSASAWIYDGDQPIVEVGLADGTSALTAPFTEASTTAGAEFFISRLGSTLTSLVVNYTMSGTAMAGSDYVGLSGSATIPVGASGVRVQVIPINDTLTEGTESLVMNLSPSPGVYGTRVFEAMLLLADNDKFTSETVLFSPSSATIQENVGTYLLPVTLSGSPSRNVSVNYRVIGGTAAGNGIDFTLAEGVLHFAIGEVTKNIPIVILQDALPETAETIILELLHPVGANLGTSQFTLTVNNFSMPEAFTDPVSNLLTNSARLNGRLMPGGMATSYWFEYGNTKAYGNVTNTQNLAAGGALTQINIPLTGLSTAVHYRLVAQNANGTSYGINQSINQAFLGALSLSSGSLSPSFSSNISSYSVQVSNLSDQISVTASPLHLDGVMNVRINHGAALSFPSGVASAQLDVLRGNNPIEVKVLSPDGSVENSYLIRVYRPTWYEERSAGGNIIGANAAPMEDFDHDGVLNILEFAFGTEANSRSSGLGRLRFEQGVILERGQPILKSLTDGGNLHAIFMRNKQAFESGIVYAPSFSADLVTWQEGMATPVVLAEDAEYEVLSVPLPVMSGNGVPAKFFRLGVSE